MAEDFKSLEAVSVAIDGIKSQLALMSKVFFWTAEVLSRSAIF